MNIIVYILFIIIALVLLFIAAVYTTRAAINVRKASDYNTNENLKSAHRYLTWAAVIIWIIFGTAILVVVLTMIGGIFFSPEELAAGAVAETAGITEEESVAALTKTFKKVSAKTKAHVKSTSTFESFIHVLVTIMMLAIIILALFDGILSAVAASKITKTPNYNTEPLKTAYDSAVIAAVLGIGGGSVVGVMFMVYLIGEHRKK